MKSWLSAAVLLVTMLMFGFVFGGVVSTRILSSGGMGIDQLADALGGVMVGTVGGLIVGVILVGWLSPSMRMVAATIAILGTGASVLYLRATPANIRAAQPVTYPPPPVESFSLMLETSDPYEGARQPDPSLPWNHLQIGSNMAFSYVLNAEPTQMCIAAGALQTDDGISRLRNIRTLLQALPTADFPCSPAPCPTCTSVGLAWYLDQERFNVGFDAACWRNEPIVQPLRTAVETILADNASAVSCEPR